MSAEGAAPSECRASGPGQRQPSPGEMSKLQATKWYKSGMSETDESYKKQLQSSLGPLFARREINLVILFGSRVSGSYRSSSDLDLAILGDKELDTIELTNTVIHLLRFSDVDIVDLQRSSPTLAMVVARKGEVLYEREPGRFAVFCSLAARRYEDARKIRDAQRQSIRHFLHDRGL
jgi:predicted nucleotidyltransferase